MEQSALDYLETDLFKSIALRAFVLSESSSPYPQLPSLVNCIRKQAADKGVSNVTYVEIISERAHSKPTLIGVISRVQKIFVQGLNQKYVTIIGDAKTYNSEHVDLDATALTASTCQLTSKVRMSLEVRV